MRRISLLAILIIATILIWIYAQVGWSQPTPMASTPNSLALTASEIVGQATQQALTQNSGFSIQQVPAQSSLEFTTIPIFPTEPNLELTASEIFMQLTNPALTETARPTKVPLSAAEIENMGRRYMNQLTVATGFSHPVFKSIVTEALKADVQDSFRESNLELQSARITFSGGTWVLLVAHQGGLSVLGDYLYVFHLIDGNIILVRNPMTDLNGFVLGLGGYRFVQWNNDASGYFQDKQSIDPSYKRFGFTDWNHNGLPDIAIFQGDTGNCCPFRLRLLELKADGTAVDISPPSFDIVPYAFIDAHGTGQMDIIGVNGKAGASPNYYHWFGWNGTTYADTSDQHAAFYEPQINRFKQRLIRDASCYNPSHDFDLENTLYNYSAMHQFDKGWAEIEPLLKWDSCTAAQIKEFGYWIDGVMGEIKAHIF